MNPFPDWRPHRPSPGLRQAIFHPADPGLSGPRALRRTPPWLSATLVLAMSWTGTVLVWFHAETLGSTSHRAGAASDALALVAQNSIPAATFAFTNAALFPSTNASFSGPNTGRD